MRTEYFNAYDPDLFRNLRGLYCALRRADTEEAMRAYRLLIRQYGRCAAYDITTCIIDALLSEGFNLTDPEFEDVWDVPPLADLILYMNNLPV